MERRRKKRRDEGRKEWEARKRVGERGEKGKEREGQREG